MIRLMKNTFYNEEEVKKKLCNFITDTPRLSMFNKCSEFEERFAKYQGRKYAVLVNSGSSANLALIQSMINKKDIQKGHKIAFSSLTWATNVMPIIQLGFLPVPVDINLKTLCVSPKTLKEVIKQHSGYGDSQLRVLFLTHLLGFCDDINEIKRICNENDIILIEDTCESLGSEVGGVKLGSFGYASTFSFFVGHHLSTIEGGMICTDDKELYEHLLMVRCHGWNRDLSQESKEELRKKFNISEFNDAYTFYNPAYNLRPTEITGFLGCEQLKYIHEINQKRYKNFLKYQQTTKQEFDLSHMDIVSNFAYPIIFKDKESFEIAKEKLSKIVEIRPIVGGSIPEQPFYKFLKKNCSNAKQVHDLGFYIPNNPDLTEDELNQICELLK